MVGSAVGETSSESPKKRSPSAKRKHKAKLYSFNVSLILKF